MENNNSRAWRSRCRGWDRTVAATKLQVWKSGIDLTGYYLSTFSTKRSVNQYGAYIQDTAVITEVCVSQTAESAGQTEATQKTKLHLFHSESKRDEVAVSLKKKNVVTDVRL